MSLRESKKQATRAAISDASARLLLDGGLDGLTVARVAEAAGVSTRTFHNYFPDLEAAVYDFVARTFSVIADEIRGLPEQMGICEVLETVFKDALTTEGMELHSASSLIMIGERLHGARNRDSAHHLNTLFSPVEAVLRERAPEESELGARVLIRSYGVAGVTALEEYMVLPEPRDVEKGRELIAQAFQALRRAG